VEFCNVQGVGFTGGPEEARHGGISMVPLSGGDDGFPGGEQRHVVLAWERGRKATFGSWPSMEAAKGGSDTHGSCGHPNL
jgi:hypothetical protein